MDREEEITKSTNKATYTISFTNGLIQTIYKDESSLEYRYYSNDTVYISYTSNLGKQFRGLGSAQEMKKIVNNQIDHKHKNISIEETGKVEVMMGVLCKEVICKYEFKYFTEVMEFEASVWYTTEIKVDDELKTADLTHIWLRNNYIDSLKKINGFIVKQVIKYKDEMIASMEVTDFKEIENDDLIPKYYTSRPKKVGKLKPCLRQIESQRKAKYSFERLNKR